MMSAYNSVNGEWCGQNRELLTDDPARRVGLRRASSSPTASGACATPAASLARRPRRRDAVRAAARRAPAGRARARATRTGTDVERAGHADPARPSCASTPRVGAPAPAPRWSPRDEHRALAREVAAARDGAAPQRARRRRAGAAAGRRRRRAGRGDRPARRRRRTSATAGRPTSAPPAVVTPLDGLRAALPGVESSRPESGDAGGGRRGRRRCGRGGRGGRLHAADEGEYIGSFDPGARDAVPAVETRRRAALAELARRLGRPAPQDRRRRPRRRCGCTPSDEALIRAVAAANPRTVVVVVAGARRHHRGVAGRGPGGPAGLVRRDGGRPRARRRAARASRNPAGGCRSPFPATRPTCRRSTGTPPRVTYDRWHGQRQLDRDGVAGRVPARLRPLLHDLRARRRRRRERPPTAIEVHGRGRQHRRARGRPRGAGVRHAAGGGGTARGALPRRVRPGRGARRGAARRADRRSAPTGSPSGTGLATGA